jgi:hypothetical protein
LLALIFIVCCNIICFTLILGCFDKNPINSDNSLKDTDKLNEAGFPLALGNRWVYSAETEITFIYSDTTFTRREDSEVIWEITAKEQVLGEEAFRVETTQHFLNRPDSSMTLLTWFAAEGDTLRAIASGPGAGRFWVAFQLHKISGSNQDEPDDWPVNVLIFPLEVGKEWAYWRPDPTFWDNKVVEAIDNVSVPAGNFEAFRIAYNLTADKVEYKSNQWFTSVGIVKATENVEDDQGSTIDEKLTKTIGKSTMSLVSYQIKK